MNLFEVAKEISDRLTRICLRDERGRRRLSATEAPRNSRPTRTGATISCCTSTSMGITAPGSERITERDKDRIGGETDPAFRIARSEEIP